MFFFTLARVRFEFRAHGQNNIFAAEYFFSYSLIPFQEKATSCVARGVSRLTVFFQEK